MTDYTMKKLWNCLITDSRNHSDLKEAVREELKKYYDDIEDDEITDGNCYKAVCWYMDMEDYEMKYTELFLTNSQVAELLNSGTFEGQW